VRTPQKRTSSSSINISARPAKPAKNWSRDLSESDDDACPTRTAHAQRSRNGGGGNVARSSLGLGRILDVPSDKNLANNTYTKQSSECTLSSAVVSTVVVDILLPHALTNGSSNTSTKTTGVLLEEEAKFRANKTIDTLAARQSLNFKELEAESKGTKFEPLMKMYNAILQEVVQKDREQAVKVL